MIAYADALVHDELEGIVAMLCVRFPHIRRREIENVVTRVYDELAGKAIVTTHLIPLTLNRSRTVLTDGSR